MFWLPRREYTSRGSCCLGEECGVQLLRAVEATLVAGRRSGASYQPPSLTRKHSRYVQSCIDTFGLESREYCNRDPARWPRGTLYAQKFALTSPTSRGRLVGIVRSRNQATELLYWYLLGLWNTCASDCIMSKTLVFCVEISFCSLRSSPYWKLVMLLPVRNPDMCK
jgi:hypothetical protein